MSLKCVSGASTMMLLLASCFIICTAQDETQVENGATQPEISWDQDTWMLPVTKQFEEFPCNFTYLPVEYCKEYMHDALQKETSKLVNAENATYISVKIPYNISIRYNDVLQSFKISDGEQAISKFCEAHNMDEESCSLIIKQLHHVRKMVKQALLARVHRLEELLNTYSSNTVPIESDISGHPMLPVVKEAIHHAKEILDREPDNLSALNAITTFYKYAISSNGMANLVGMYDGAATAEYITPYFKRMVKVMGQSLNSGSCYCEITTAGVPTCTECVLTDTNATSALQFGNVLVNLGRIQVHLGRFDQVDQTLGRAWGLFKSLKASQESSLEVANSQLEEIFKLFILASGNDRKLDKTMVYIYELQLIRPDTTLKELLLFKHLYRATSVPFVFLSKDEIEYNVNRTDESLHHLIGLKPLLKQLQRTDPSSNRMMNSLPINSYYVLYTEMGNSGQLAKQQYRRQELARLFREIEPTLNYQSPKICAPKFNNGLAPVPSDRRIRIGYMSAFVFRHSVGKLACGGLLKLLQQYPNKYSMTVLQVGRVGQFDSDPGTCTDLRKYLQNAPEPSGHKVLSMDFNEDDQVIQQVTRVRRVLASLELDILVFGEVGLATQTYFTAFSRIARVQIGFWGHALTSGIENTLDYMILPKPFLSKRDADKRVNLTAYLHEVGTHKEYLPHAVVDSLNTQLKAVEPQFPLCDGNFQDHIPFVEKVLCTDSLMTYFTPMQVTETHIARAREHLFIGMEEIGKASTMEDLDTYNYYFVPHKLMKLHVDYDELFAEILIRDPNAILVTSQGDKVGLAFSTFTYSRDVFESRFYATLRRMVQDSGLPNHFAEKRIAWFPSITMFEYSAMSKVCNAILDVGPISAGVTALEILSVGSPFVSLPDTISTGPSVCGMYDRMGVSREGLCASTASEYIEFALAIGRDRTVEKTMRARIEGGLATGSLYHDETVGREWDTIFTGSLGLADWYQVSELPKESCSVDSNEVDDFSDVNIDELRAKPTGESPEYYAETTKEQAERERQEAMGNDPKFRKVQTFFLPGPAFL